MTAASEPHDSVITISHCSNIQVTLITLSVCVKTCNSCSLFLLMALQLLSSFPTFHCPLISLLPFTFYLLSFPCFRPFLLPHSLLTPRLTLHPIPLIPLLHSLTPFPSFPHRLLPVPILPIPHLPLLPHLALLHLALLPL